MSYASLRRAASSSTRRSRSGVAVSVTGTTAARACNVSDLCSRHRWRCRQGRLRREPQHRHPSHPRTTGVACVLDHEAAMSSGERRHDFRAGADMLTVISGSAPSMRILKSSVFGEAREHVRQADVSRFHFDVRSAVADPDLDVARRRDADGQDACRQRDHGAGRVLPCAGDAVAQVIEPSCHEHQAVAAWHSSHVRRSVLQSRTVS